jgi:Flp pilus assembly protein TadD
VLSPLAIVMVCISFGACTALTRAPGESATAVPKPEAAKPVKAEPPAAALAKAEPAVAAESRQLYQQALTALGAGRYAEAERELLVVMRREPQLAGPHANLGILYARTGRPAQALASFREAIRLNPNRPAYYNELGMMSRREGKFDEARGYYAKALDLDPDYAYAHLNIGILYDLYLQDTEKAVQHYRRYQELTPSESGTVTKWIADLEQRDRARQAKGGKSG